MDKMQKMIMVVKTDVLLWDDKYFQWFKYAEDYDYEKIVLSNYEYIKRWDAEINPSFKQPIGYCTIINPITKKIFVYKRASDKTKYTENRLHGKYSWWIWWHIDDIDDWNHNPIYASLLREIQEEVNISDYSQPKVIWYINDDSNDVWKVHFWILYVIETHLDVSMWDWEMVQCEFMSIEDMEKLFSNPDVEVESWSKIAFEPIKKMLNN